MISLDEEIKDSFVNERVYNGSVRAQTSAQIYIIQTGGMNEQIQENAFAFIANKLLFNLLCSFDNTTSSCSSERTTPKTFSRLYNLALSMYYIAI